MDVHSESSVYPIFPILVEESKLILHHYNLFKIFLANFLHIISHGALVNWQRFSTYRLHCSQSTPDQHLFRKPESKLVLLITQSLFHEYLDFPVSWAFCNSSIRGSTEPH